MLAALGCLPDWRLRQQPVDLLPNHQRIRPVRLVLNDRVRRHAEQVIDRRHQVARVVRAAS